MRCRLARIKAGDTLTCARAHAQSSYGKAEASPDFYLGDLRKLKAYNYSCNARVGQEDESVIFLFLYARRVASGEVYARY